MKIGIDKARDVVIETIIEMFNKQEKTFFNGLNLVAICYILRSRFDEFMGMFTKGKTLDINILEEEVKKNLPSLLSQPINAVGMQYTLTEQDIQNLFVKLKRYGVNENG